MSQVTRSLTLESALRFPKTDPKRQTQAQIIALSRDDARLIIRPMLAGRLLDMVIPSACYEMDTSLDGAWWVGAAAAVAKAPRVYPSLGGFFCAPLVPSRPCTAGLPVLLSTLGR